MYDESMTLDCQKGTCDDCPERGHYESYCACVCHIPDPEQPDESDLLAQTFYERFYA